VDWFANIGDFISAMTPTLNLNQLGSCIVTERSIVNQFIGSNFSLKYPLTQTISTPPGDISCDLVYNSKGRSVGLVPPGLVIKSDFRFDHATRALDALALILQKLR